jgi:hypothetical protein
MPAVILIGANKDPIKKWYQGSCPAAQIAFRGWHIGFSGSGFVHWIRMQI